MEDKFYFDAYESAYKQFFIAESKRLDVRFNLFEFAIRYNAFKMRMDHKMSGYEILKNNNSDNFVEHEGNKFINFESELGQRLHKRHEIPELVFFGLRDSVGSTHQYLTHKKAFWALFTYLYTYIEYPSFMDDEIQNACKYDGRLGISLESRNYSFFTMFLATQLFETSLNSLINETVGLLDQDELIDRAEESLLSNKMRFCTPNGKIIKPRDVITDRAIQIQSKTNELMGRLFKSGDTTYVYRGFDIRNHQNVRKDRVKLGNINANIQDTGTGNSYTPNFSIAKQFALSKFSDGVALSNHERVFNKSHYKFNFLGIDPHEFLNITNRKPVVAKYEINKKDVLFSMLSDGTKQIQDSNEIVCPFKGAKLLDYRFVN